MSPERMIGGVLFALAAGAFGVLALALRRTGAFERALDAGDFAFFAVFALFGALCAWLGWRLWRSASPAALVERSPATVEPDSSHMPSRRVSVSRACAAFGVLLMMLSVLVPEAWHPVVLFFVGLALLAVSHALTPCVERLEQLHKARDSMSQF